MTVSKHRAVASAARLLAVVAKVAAFIAAPAAAQQFDEALAFDAPLALDDVIVSAGRIPVDAQSYARANSILTGEELERRQVKTVADALRQLPGLHVSRSGGIGGATAVRLRGSEANHVLVLVDGVEQANSSEGFEFSDITADQIERIEVLRGPQSALYGAGATAGVINIITKGGLRGDTRATLTLEAGTGPSQAASGLLQTGDDHSDVAVGISWRNEDGWDSSGSGGEKDGLENLTLNFQANADVSETTRVRGTARFTERAVEFDPTSFGCGSPNCYVADGVGSTKGRDMFASLAADMELFGGAAVVTPRVSYAFDENDTVTNFGPSSNDATTLKIDPQVTLFFGAEDQHSVTGAVEYKQETFSSSFAGNDDKSRVSYGAALDYQGQITDALFVQGGVRYDINDDFDNAVSWALSASYGFDFGTTIRGSVGQGQTNPTFFEQFGFQAGSFTGNPNVTPEKNFSWDVGVSQSVWDDRITLSATYFNSVLTDEITGFGNTVVNSAGDTQKQGLEFAMTAQPMAGLSIGASYTYLTAEDANGNAKTRRPTHSGGVNIAYTFFDDRATIGADLTYFGDHKQRDFSSATFTSPTVDVDGYLTVDLNASFKATENVEFYGTVKNLFDESYQEVLGYAGQPLTGYVGLRLTW